MVREALEGAERIQHRTVWWHGNATTDDRDDALMFITFDGETARRARAALESAGVLCAEVLGVVAGDGSGRILEPERPPTGAEEYGD